MSTTVFNKAHPVILFWDDEADTEKELLFTEIRMGFEMYGWKTRITMDREDAQSMALEDDIDAVVLDLKEGDKPVGLDILKYLRMNRPYLPIVMFTVYSDIGYIQDAMKEDVSYYLTVPIRSYHDIIRAIEVAEEREKAKQRLVQDQYFASIGKLAAGVAHFIKNSLWNISSRTQFLLERDVEKEQSQKLLTTIDRRCGDAKKVVDNLLNFASRRPGCDKALKRLNVNDVLEEVLQLVSFEMVHSGVSLDKNMDFENAFVNAEEFELKEAFLNIVKNAVEAMPQGGTLRVGIQKEDQSDIIVKISDTGVGMSDEILKNIFIPYYTTKGNSAGFGLFDTRRIIHNLKGRIHVESEPGKGTCIKVTIPRATPPADEDADQSGEDLS
ncbi:MAG: response regulator [bacterium]|nr:response regulator [bacterium]